MVTYRPLGVVELCSGSVYMTEGGTDPFSERKGSHRGRNSSVRTRLAKARYMTSSQP